MGLLLFLFEVITGIIFFFSGDVEMIQIGVILLIAAAIEDVAEALRERTKKTGR